ncbi:MAG: hypothetical protein CM1200mP31_3300 [Candidatus Neomarinimicrobiota bacterium]|nr:MAG: hypothetical protein CM1200mP31_3300 [Candidatus Neomarinimicrobiota bacterium]
MYLKVIDDELQGVALPVAGKGCGLHYLAILL